MPDWPMVVINNIVHLSVKNLTPWFSQSFIDKQTSVGNYPCIYAHDPEQPNRKEVKLIPYNGIPEATRQQKGMPSAEELLQKIKTMQLGSLVAFNQDAYNYYLQNPITAKRAKEKAEQASWLVAIASAKPSQAKALGFSSKDELYEQAIVQMDKQAKERNWHAWKCTTVLALRKRLKPFQQALKGSLPWADAWASAISKKTGNSNAQKIELDQQALMIQLYSDANAKPNFEQVWMIYTRKANEMIGLGHWTNSALISPSTVRAFLSKPATRQLWYEARHGYQEYRNVFDPVIQRQRATFANALWVIDGTPIHRYFQHLDQGKYFRWNIFIVLDAHSECVLGFWISESEDTASVLGALRSACLVSGKLPHQVLYDNGSAITSYRSQHALDAISVVSFPAQAGNARSKPVEGYFHWFNQNVEKFRPGFTANPFAISLNNRPNREALSLAVKQGKLALAEQAIDQLITDFTIANNTPRKMLGGMSAIQVYRQSIEATAARQREFNELIDVQAFWTEPGEQKKIRASHEGKITMVKTWVPQLYEFTNRGIDITLNTKRFTYDIEDPAFRVVNIGQRFSVKYEPNPALWVDGRPEKLLLYINGTPVMWKGQHLAAVQKQLVPMAVADYSEGTRKQLDERLSNKRNQRELVAAHFNEMLEHTKRNGTHTQVITENAFDKDVLQNTEAEIRNQIIKGENYRLGEAPAPSGLPRTKLDRLSLGMDGPEDDTDETL
jgi:hypothetical protein